MRKLEILCVGKVKESYFIEGINEYVKRLSRFCEVKITELPDFPDDGKSAQKESDNILKRLDGFSVLTDLKGKEVTSEEFSSLITGAYDGGKNVQIVIGGSRGVTDEVRAKASAVVRFGKVTYPHKLMRLIVAEQAYRAFCIEQGTEYHK